MQMVTGDCLIAIGCSRRKIIQAHQIARHICVGHRKQGCGFARVGTHARARMLTTVSWLPKYDSGTESIHLSVYPSLEGKYHRYRKDSSKQQRNKG